MFNIVDSVIHKLQIALHAFSVSFWTVKEPKFFLATISINISPVNIMKHRITISQLLRFKCVI